MSETQQKNTFPIREAREIIKDLLPPKPSVYWADFLFHIVSGWGAFVLTLKAQLFSIPQLLFFLVSVLALFRAAIFIHELTHLRKGTFNIFRVVWNVLCGFPLMVPSFLYLGVHNDHHKMNLYGTEEDGEYFPFVEAGRMKIILFVLTSFFLPIFFFTRFVILAPLSYIHQGIRSVVLEKASSLCIDLSYRRSLSSLNATPLWRVQEAMTCLYGWVFVFLVAQDFLTPAAGVLWYLVLAAVFFVNSLRTLAAHRYKHSGQEALDLREQLLDSVNVPDSLFGVLWAPVGLRFHAAHHLVPEIPYHALGEAHRRFLEGFSEKKLYKQTSCWNLWTTLRRLWLESGK
ncbi:fatty acid desaturase [Candidatus Nitromaritima sp. SCGC AAA799-A02]|nr:fatty acid desaturase [Candidatus Nitromaritima sp. SCGC AAA799-A02]